MLSASYYKQRYPPAAFGDRCYLSLDSYRTCENSPPRCRSHIRIHLVRSLQLTSLTWPPDVAGLLFGSTGDAAVASRVAIARQVTVAPNATAVGCVGDAPIRMNHLLAQAIDYFETYESVKEGKWAGRTDPILASLSDVRFAVEATSVSQLLQQARDLFPEAHTPPGTNQRFIVLFDALKARPQTNEDHSSLCNEFPPNSGVRSPVQLSICF